VYPRCSGRYPPANRGGVLKLPPQLGRPFRIVAFDWDGTAVPDRRADAAPIRGPIERLLRRGVLVVVITGTNSQNVDGQLSRAIRGPHKRNLFLATNRGSEVYAFEPAARDPLLRWKRQASAEEDRLLTQIADSVQAELSARTGLEIQVIHARLNRRKIDLIPLPEWRDPPKSAIGDLLLAVQTRLTGAGLAGGLREAFEVVRRTALEKGLPDARITTDVKHIEIGLTDKADSMAWVLRELARPRGVANEDLLVAGDEFGPVAGFAGSDAKLISPQAAGAAFVSVGPEPGGAPRPVLHLGGGPDRFRELLEAQAALHPVELPDRPEHRRGWALVEDSFVLTREHELESLFALGNGYVGTRGSLAEGSSLSAPATFVAGAFIQPSTPGTPELLRLPDWASIEGSIDGHPFRLEAGETLEHRRILDMRRGQLWREWRQRDPAGRVTRVRGFRLASRADSHVLVQSITLTPENYTGTVRVKVPLPPQHVVRGSHVQVALASGTLVELPERFVEPRSDAGEVEVQVEAGKTYRLDRVIAVRTSRDGTAPAEDAAAHLEVSLREQGVEGLVAAHDRAWEEGWQATEISVDGDPTAERALRFAVYHLLSAANPADEHVSIGARALTGSGYQGHVFWDTEIFMLPFFALEHPAAARALLMYRFHTLPAARAKAARLGFRGALYAWESADSGEEVTPAFMVAPDGEVIRILAGEQEHHISADVAYGVWSYWRATLDERFLLEAGAEILIETARFWASRAEQEEDGWYHIRGVIGPDEYHESVDDNAYTNGMARWNLEIGRDVVTLLADRWPERWRQLSRRLRLDPAEPPAWARTAAAMYAGLDERTGLFEQFQGYFDLEEIDLTELEPRSAPVDVLLGRERVRRSKVIKQPDVVMLLHLLWDQLPPDLREANFRYYEPRCGHGSSLSPAIHALVAARLGDVPLAERYFRQAAAIDLANDMGNAAGGVHAAALGGLWQAAVFGFAGLELAAGGPTLRPNLPPGWTRLAFQVRWRGRKVAVELPPTALEEHVAEGVRP
jgi:kojibiose phosphorylase